MRECRLRAAARLCGGASASGDNCIPEQFRRHLPHVADDRRYTNTGHRGSVIVLNINTNFRMLIDGRLVGGIETFGVVNPATEDEFAQAPNCSLEQMESALGAARRAFPDWRGVPAEERAARLIRIAERIMEHRDTLATLLTREQGKPLADAKAEIGRSADWLIRTSQLRVPDKSGTSEGGRAFDIHHVPVGVVAAISPWNFPVTLSIWKLAPALLAGNVIVIKPSPFTPLTMLKIGEIIADVVPFGVVNILSGDDRLGPWLTAHPQVDKIAFTGSTKTGKAVMRSAAGTLKRITLELGGNDPAIVMPDADIDAVAEKLFWSAFRNAGQVCVASKRIYVHDSMYDNLRDAMLRIAALYPPGNGEHGVSRIGPLQNRVQYDRVRELIADAKANGYVVLSAPGQLPEKGYFIAPTFIDNPPDTARVVVEEQFGPVVPLMCYRTMDEVVRRANDSDAGLGASVWGQDVESAAQLAARLDAGSVWINSGSTLDPFVPFAGHKQSGLGVENGLDGLLEYCNVQVIMR